VKRVAVIGAGGFIGNRLVEHWHGADRYEVVPVVRRPAALALAKRFPLGGRIADVLDEEALATAMTGCDAAVATVAGPPATITGMAAPLIGAARRSGVRRIVYLSSQMVYGQAPAFGTLDETPLPRRHAFEYNRAKAEAEQALGRLAAAAGVELVTLRPGIVYGPRSRWTGSMANELLSGETFLVSDAPGVCNGIYVDNLVHAIERAIDVQGAAGQMFFVNDEEELRWSDLVEPVADALGLDRAAIARPTLVEALGAGPSFARRKLRTVAKAALRTLPKRARRAVGAARRAALEHAPGAPIEKPVTYSREMALLQSCAVRLRHEKARNLLGYHPPVSHEQAMVRSIAWLRFAGYPVR
jgi:nucleoside-diphosphate-sugar epimerase